VRARVHGKAIWYYQIILHTAGEIMLVYVLHVAVDVNSGKGK
jgi:hypothetical protein